MQQGGLIGPPNMEEAVKFMRAAAEAGHGMAQHGYAVMFLEGEGVEKDAQKAIEWFEKAAEQGMQGSLTTLGMMYQDGYGVEKDEAKAMEYYKKAGFEM
jgi:TPR repeat protein